MSASFNTLKVRQKINETVDSSSFLLDIPEELKEAYTFISGQYLTVKVNVNGSEERRAYSIFTSPVENKFGFTVKRVEQGKVSNYLIDRIFEGDRLEIMTPEGKFTLKPNQDQKRDHYFIAGGSGITPIMSMIVSILEEEPKSSAYLLYANRNENNVIFKERLDELKEKYKGQLVVQYIISQPTKQKAGGLKGLFGKATTSWTGLTGRIDNKCLGEFLNDNTSKSGNDVYYLCGPGGLIENSEKFLLSKGIVGENIKKEFFTSSSEPKKAQASSSGEGCHVKVQLNGDKFEINVPSDKTVLEALLDEGKDAPYSCTSGACSTCIAKVNEGEVEMDACFALDDDEIKSGYILTCQARAKTSSLDLNFDA